MATDMLPRLERDLNFVIRLNCAKILVHLKMQLRHNVEHDAGHNVHRLAHYNTLLAYLEWVEAEKGPGKVSFRQLMAVDRCRRQVLLGLRVDFFLLAGKP